MASQDTCINEKKKVAGGSVLASVVLTGGKLVVGVSTGSLGIISEAAHSALDLVAALITYFAVSVSDKPADEEHHYGHAKIENFSALVEAVLLFVTCGWIISEAFKRLFFHAQQVQINLWSFLILAISIVVDFSRARALARVAKKYDSQALEADALHFSSDIFSSAVVIVGLIFAKFGMGMADPIAALVVALIVILASWKLAKRTIDALLDKAPKGLDKTIAAEVMETPGVAGVHRVRLRKSGGLILGDLHVVMDRHVSFIDGYRIASVVEEKLHKYSNDIVVHFEPEDDWEATLQTIEQTSEIVNLVMKGNATEFLDYHEVEVSQGQYGISISLHIVLPKDISVAEARVRCDDLKKRINVLLPQANIHFHIEPCEGSCGECADKCNDLA